MEVDPVQCQKSSCFPGDLCSLSTTGGRTTNWCGIGWTGQPAVWELEMKPGWRSAHTPRYPCLRIDRYSYLEHLVTGDIVKGSLTVDPDGFLHLQRLSRWKLRSWPSIGLTVLSSFEYGGDEVNPMMWNDDWDGAPLILKDYLITGMFSWFHIVHKSLVRPFGQGRSRS